MVAGAVDEGRRIKEKMKMSSTEQENAVVKRENAVAEFFEVLAQLVVLATRALKDEVNKKKGGLN